MSKTEMEEACDKLGIRIQNTHMALESEPQEERPDWVYDRWSCTLTYQGRSVTLTYKTGVGHRVLAPRVERNGNKFWMTGSPMTANSLHEAAVRNMLIIPRHKTDSDTHKRGELRGPSVADVIYGYIMDASAMEETFDDWCDSLGYNNDSIKHLNLYLECQRSAKKLAMFLGYQTMQDLRGKEH